MMKVNQLFLIVIFLGIALYSKDIQKHSISVVKNSENILADDKPVISDLVNLAAMAQQYYRKPNALGGGGNSFVGWNIPSNLASTKNGSYKVEKIRSQSAIISGTILDERRGTKRKIRIIIAPNDYKLERDSAEYSRTSFNPYKDFLSDSPIGSAGSNYSVTKDFLLSDLTNLAAMAQQFYRKPSALGGGGNSFSGWTIPQNLSSTDNGEYIIENIGNESLSIIGTVKILESRNISEVKIRMNVFPHSINAEVIN